jgi:hypothetical protein
MNNEEKLRMNALRLAKSQRELTKDEEVELKKLEGVGEEKVGVKEKKAGKIIGG